MWKTCLCLGYSSILKNQVILLLLLIIMIVTIYWVPSILLDIELNVLLSFLGKDNSLLYPFYRWGYLSSEAKWFAMAARLIHSRAKTQARPVQFQSPFLSIPLSSLQGVSMPFPLSVLWSLNGALIFILISQWSLTISTIADSRAREFNRN